MAAPGLRGSSARIATGGYRVFVAGVVFEQFSCWESFEPDGAYCSVFLVGRGVGGGVVSFPLMVRSIKGSFQNSNARLELAARSLGASRISAFVTITLPLARNGIIAGCLLAFARAMGEFGATVMLAGNIPDQTRTIPLAIYSMSQRVGGFEQSWRLVLISVLIALVAVGIGEYLENRRRKIGQN